MLFCLCLFLSLSFSLSLSLSLYIYIYIYIYIYNLYILITKLTEIKFPRKTFKVRYVIKIVGINFLNGLFQLTLNDIDLPWLSLNTGTTFNPWHLVTSPDECLVMSHYPDDYLAKMKLEDNTTIFHHKVLLSLKIKV